MNKIVITKKQRVLILNSESAKREPFRDLYIFLEKHEEVNQEDIEKYSQLKNINSYFDDLLNSCRGEWEVSKTHPTIDLGENFSKYERVCELCNYKYLKIENRINNKLSGKTLVIGSECAKEFGDTIQGLIKLSYKDAKKASNRRFLESEMPGIRHYVESSHQYINNLEIIISDDLDRKWVNLRKEIRTIYNNFIGDKQADTKELKRLWKYKSVLTKEIDNFIEENKKGKYIANSKILKWLLDHQEEDVIQMIKEDGGYIQWGTAHRIFEHDLMRLILRELNKFYKKKDIEIVDMDLEKSSVNMKFNKNNRFIIASIDYKELILNHGGYIFKKVLDDSFDDIYNNCFITSIESQSKILEMTRDSSYRLAAKHLRDDEVIFQKDQQYYQVQPLNLANDLKKHFFNQISNHEIDNIIGNNIVKTMSARDYENYRQAKRVSEDLNIR